MSEEPESLLLNVLAERGGTRGVLVRQRVTDRVCRTLVLVAGEEGAEGWIETEYLGWGKTQRAEVTVSEILVDRCVERFQELRLVPWSEVGSGSDDPESSEVIVEVQAAGDGAAVMKWSPGGEVAQGDPVIAQGMKLVAVGFDEVLMDPDYIGGAIEGSYQVIKAELKAIEKGEEGEEEWGGGEVGFDAGL